MVDRQRRNVPIEKAPFPKRWDSLLDTSCQMTGQPPAWYGNQNPVSQFMEKAPSGPHGVNIIHSSRLNKSTTFLLGSRANKALELGGTRGESISSTHTSLSMQLTPRTNIGWLSSITCGQWGKTAYLLCSHYWDLAYSTDYTDDARTPSRGAEILCPTLLDG